MTVGFILELDLKFAQLKSWVFMDCVSSMPVPFHCCRLVIRNLLSVSIIASVLRLKKSLTNAMSRRTSREDRRRHTLRFAIEIRKCARNGSL